MESLLEIDHNVTATKLECTWSKYTNHKKKYLVVLENLRYANASYLLLSGKKKLESLEI